MRGSRSSSIAFEAAHRSPFLGGRTRPLTTTYADSLTSDYTRLPKVST